MLFWKVLATLLLGAPFAFAAADKSSEAARPELPAEQISQIVVVYSPTTDHNGALINLHENVAGIVEAAREKNMRVVFVASTPNELPEALKARVKRVVSREPSWLVVATHGGEMRSGPEEKGPVVDTSLTFPGPLSVSSMEDVLGDKNVRGVSLNSCHSGSPAFLVPKGVRCAAADSSKEAFPAGLTAVNDALAEIIRLPGPVAVDRELRRRIDKIVRENEVVRKSMTNADGSPVTQLASDPKLPRYEFRGKRSEVVDENGRPLEPCDFRLLESARSLLLEGGASTGSGKKQWVLPGIHRPRPSEELLEPDMLPTLQCLPSGQWIVEPPKICTGVSIALQGDDCEKAMTTKVPQWIGTIDADRWRAQCVALRKTVDDARRKKVTFRRPLCITGCTELGGGRPPFFAAPTACSLRGDGRVCGLSLARQRIATAGPPIAECCGGNAPNTFRWDGKSCVGTCFQPKTRTAATDGSCFQSELPARQAPNGTPVTDDDPIFFCPPKQFKFAATDTSSLMVPTQTCCEKAGRVWDKKSLVCKPAVVQKGPGAFNPLHAPVHAPPKD